VKKNINLHSCWYYKRTRIKLKFVLWYSWKDCHNGHASQEIKRKKTLTIKEISSVTRAMNLSSVTYILIHIFYSIQWKTSELELSTSVIYKGWYSTYAKIRAWYEARIQSMVIFSNIERVKFELERCGKYMGG
jgi:hypothetical protein